MKGAVSRVDGLCRYQAGAEVGQDSPSAQSQCRGACQEVLSQEAGMAVSGNQRRRCFCPWTELAKVWAEYLWGVQLGGQRPDAPEQPSFLTLFGPKDYNPQPPSYSRCSVVLSGPWELSGVSVLGRATGPVP